MILISLSPNIVAVSLFNAFSAKNASFFLIMNIRVLGKKLMGVFKTRNGEMTEWRVTMWDTVNPYNY